MPTIKSIKINNVLYTLLDETKALINSPSFTGEPKAPTAQNINNTDQIATTAFVHSLIDEKLLSIENELKGI